MLSPGLGFEGHEEEETAAKERSQIFLVTVLLLVVACPFRLVLLLAAFRNFLVLVPLTEHMCSCCTFPCSYF